MIGKDVWIASRYSSRSDEFISLWYKATCDDSTYKADAYRFCVTQQESQLGQRLYTQ